jgi:hypothetical protein
MTFAGAFNGPTLLEEQRSRGELSIINTRNIMHKVLLCMLEPDVLERVRERCSFSVAMNTSIEAQQMELEGKHTVVQEAMVVVVYLLKRDSVLRVRGIDNREAAAEHGD